MLGFSEMGLQYHFSCLSTPHFPTKTWPHHYSGFRNRGSRHAKKFCDKPSLGLDKLHHSVSRCKQYSLRNTNFFWYSSGNIISITDGNETIFWVGLHESRHAAFSGELMTEDLNLLTESKMLGIRDPGRRLDQWNPRRRGGNDSDYWSFGVITVANSLKTYMELGSRLTCRLTDILVGRLSRAN